MQVKSISVFFPAFNEEKNIAKTVEKAVSVLKNLKLDWEVLVIDDGSTDRTGKIADGLVKKNKHIKIIHQPNGGYGMALRAGFANSKKDWITYTDSDGQFDFSEINKLIEKAETADAVWGYRLNRQDPFYRHLFAKGWALSVFLFFGIKLRDLDCGFKLIRSDVIDKILPLQSTRGGMINAELAIKIKKNGFKINEVGVYHYPRVAGKPTGASFRVVIQSYLDLLKLWWNLR